MSGAECAHGIYLASSCSVCSHATGGAGRIPKQPMAPFDDRKPEPLSSEEMSEAKAAKNEHERGKIHRMLLIETMRRLRSGRSLERAHGVIHPEMTAIVRDALRLTELVFPGAKKSAELEDDAAPELSDGARSICELLERAPAARIAKLVGAGPGDVKGWSKGEKPPEPIRVRLQAKFGIPLAAWGA